MKTLFVSVCAEKVMERLRLGAGGEWAFVDLREAGEAAEGHPFGSVNIPYSRLERDMTAKVPRFGTDLVLIDGGDGVADRAAANLAAAGWTRIAIIDGGIPAWAKAGLPLFKGVHTFSKAFGEWAQHHFQTPEVGPEALQAQLQGPNPPLLIDGRPLAEHRSFTLPGAVNCPNAELALRLPADLPAGRAIVVHCAGRTRSIIGAQTLRDFGLSNPVCALRDGTQGWEIAGFARDLGADRPIGEQPDLTAAQARARDVMAREAIATLSPDTLALWLGDARRTVYCFDPRPEGEGETPPGFARAPGTTLIQQTDQFVAVKGADVVVYDPLLVRAVFAALWLRRMGIAAHVLAQAPKPMPKHELTCALAPELPIIGAGALADLQKAGVGLIDLRPSSVFATSRVAGAQWCLRPRLDRLALAEGTELVLLASDPVTAALAASDLVARGCKVLGANCQSPDEWRAAGVTVETTAAPIPESDRIDEILFCAGRHRGNLDDARAYLEWETGLLARLRAAGLAPWSAPASTEIYRSGVTTWP
ncbi:MAG: hypothetical protein K9G71_17385 [Rhodobacteraceae bacterium]|nr:hypothetical protein [Paracoccaceae bacterium]MCF8516146.1 hypothetical protein [Paracoccaceae bacterium]MCF8520417.1 hypothetical protein [Paracoccaceae bacterium]